MFMMGQFMQGILKKISDNPFYVICRRIKELYLIADRVTRRRIILSQILNTGMELLRTFIVVAIVGLLLFMKSPDTLQENRYAMMIYDGFGFNSMESFILVLSVFMVISFAVTKVIIVLLSIYTIRFDVLIRQSYRHEALKLHFSRDYEASLAVSTDELMYKAISVYSSISGRTIKMARTLFSLVVNLTIVGGLLFMLNFFATAVMCSVILFYYTTVYRLLKIRLSVYGKALYELNQQDMKILRQSFSGYQEVLLLGKTEEYLAIIKRIFAKRLVLSLKVDICDKIPSSLITILVVFTLLAIAIFVMMTEGRGQSLSTVIIFTGAAYRILPLLTEMYTFSNEVRGNSFTYQQAINDLGKSCTVQPVQKRDNTVFPASVNIQLHRVDYSYVKDSTKLPVIRDLSLTIIPGEIVVLCGRSGAGKTTVAKLVSGLIQPDRGTVTVNGLSLKDRYIRRQWYYAIGYIMQKPFFSDDTVAANIAFEIDHSKIDYRKVEEVVEQACLNDFVAALPQGLRTPIGESAIAISGGQAQRLAIARALYRDTRMLIMDEATSALDQMTAKTVIQSLLDITPKKSFLIISHGLESFACADRIVVIDNGCIVADGAYGKLFECSDLFRSLIRQYDKHIAAPT